MVIDSSRQRVSRAYIFFFFNDTATTEIYTLSLHDALPISAPSCAGARTASPGRPWRCRGAATSAISSDRKSTRLNSSHLVISYAVFCLKKKKDSLELTPVTCTAAIASDESSSSARIHDALH